MTDSNKIVSSAAGMAGDVGPALTASDEALDTAPDHATGAKRFKTVVRERLSAVLLPLMTWAARDFIGGETVEDALALASVLAGQKLATTFGLWPARGDTATRLTSDYTAALGAIHAARHDTYLSIKPPALRFDSRHALVLAETAHTLNARLHCDSHAKDTADPSRAMIEVILSRMSARQVGTTLPGRWRRSLDDADWSVERGLNVRVVKGQWPDPADPERDMHAGFLEVIDRLAGRSPHVAVATHDVPLAAEAIRRLRSAGTSCELELLFGMPIEEPLAWARRNDVPVRLYLPFGKGYVPHAIEHLRRNPRLILTMAGHFMRQRLRPIGVGSRARNDAGAGSR